MIALPRFQATEAGQILRWNEGRNGHWPPGTMKSLCKNRRRLCARIFAAGLLSTVCGAAAPAKQPEKSGPVAFVRLVLSEVKAAQAAHRSEIERRIGRHLHLAPFARFAAGRYWAAMSMAQRTRYLALVRALVLHATANALARRGLERRAPCHADAHENHCRGRENGLGGP